MTAPIPPVFRTAGEPFGADIALENILVTDSLKAVQQRVHYAMRTGAVALITGEIGSGKSTALRYVTQSLHPAEHLCLYVTATTGSILELYRQIVAALGIDAIAASRAP
jgi:general secretion pathway protein A